MGNGAHNRDRSVAYRVLVGGNLKKIGYLQDLGVDGSVIGWECLDWFIWLRIETHDGSL